MITRDQLKTELELGNSARTIGEKYGYPTKTIYGYISRYKLKSRRFKYTIDTEKLLSVSDPVTNYLAGLIATDGYLVKGHERVDIVLVGDSEKELLAKIVDYYNSDIPVNTYRAPNNKEKHQIGITADGFKAFLVNNFGLVTDNKTLNVTTPQTFSDEDCARMYVRGCFDGDGSFTISTSKLSILTKSEQFITGLRDIIEEYTGYRVTVSLTRGYPALYYQHSAAVEIQRWMYTSNEGMWLGRKFEKFKSVISATSAPHDTSRGVLLGDGYQVTDRNTRG